MCVHDNLILIKVVILFLKITTVCCYWAFKFYLFLFFLMVLVLHNVKLIYGKC